MPDADDDPEERWSWAGPWEVDSLDAEWLVLPPGLAIPRWVRGRGQLTRAEVGELPAEQKLLAVLRATYSEVAGRYLLHELTVESREPDGVEVTGALLRALPLQRFLREVVLTQASPSFDVDFGPEVIHWFQGRAGGMALYPGPISKRRPSSPETMRDVAAVYRGAAITNDSPVRAVEDAFRVERHTALYWIRKAREGGVLGERA